MKPFAIAATVALTLTAAVPARADTIDWSAGPSDKSGQVRLHIERTAPGSRNSNSSDFAAAALAGLDLTRDGPQRFVLRREAGSLVCEGVSRDRRGTGRCSFAADARFNDALVRLGLARPSDNESFALTVLNAHLATASALARFAGPPSIGNFIALTVHGATPEWLDEMAAAGQRGVDHGNLVAYRVHGVTGGWLRGLIAADPALRRAGGGEIVALKIHGVTPEWAQGLADAGYRDIPAGDLVAMRIHGVTPEFARAAAAMGGRPSAGELVARKITGRR